MSKGAKVLDVGEGFPPMPMELYRAAERDGDPEKRFLLRVSLPERVHRTDPTDPTGRRKIYAWRYTVVFSFYGRSAAAAQARANRFMLGELRREAKRSAGVDARRRGRKDQAAARCETQPQAKQS